MNEYLLNDFDEALPMYERLELIVKQILTKELERQNIYITAAESRIKSRDSLKGKLELKGYKYKTLSDITDLLGVRVVTFFGDEVDKISSIVDGLFNVDWTRSVDKRKMHEIDSFGYNSLHYICTVPKSLYFDSECPGLNEIPFEVQMRTALQHVWATMHHDTGYKSGFEIPRDYIRRLNRLAGLLEIADEEFSTIRLSITNYRRQVQSLVASGKFEDVPLDGDSWSSFLKINPFDRLNGKIASINQAEIQQVSLVPYLIVLKELGFSTLQDVMDLKGHYSEDAFALAVCELGKTDLDIISSSLGLQNLLVVYILRNGLGITGLIRMFELLNGPSPYNETRAQRIVAMSDKLPFMQAVASES